MTRRTHRWLAAALLAVLAACAHAPKARRELPAVVYPPPPGAPRARLAAVFPDPDAPPPRRSFWRALAETITGLERRDRPEDLLARPFGVAVDRGGALVVADPDLPAVLRVASDGAIARVACRGRSWSAPMAVAVADGGALLVADGGAAEIVVVAPDGTCRALGGGELERPTGVAPAPDGGAVVVDPPRHQVVRLSATGAVLARWGSRGEGEGELSYPTAIARAPDGTYLVVDALNFRVVRLAADGRWLGAFGSAGDEGGALGRPKGVAVGDDGRIYVSDAHRDEVLVFGPAGEFEFAIGESGSAPGTFALPAGVAIAGRALRVADTQNGRVQTFEILGGTP